MYRTVDVLAKILAPIMPFTMDEVWGYLGRPGSVHSDSFPQKSGRPVGEQKQNVWSAVLNLRNKVNIQLEAQRRDKKIGKSLESHIEISGRHPELVEGSVQPSDLEELFIVSKVILRPTDGEETITVTRAEDHGMKKCVRCWKYWDRVGSHADHPELCDRCTKVVLNLG
jgi:isoleucyl-tRNA synthetase